MTAMYDGEARGSRLLDRARLSPQDQCLVLVGARYSLALDDIAESLVMQFPDFKAPPPVMGKDGQLISRPKGSGKNIPAAGRTKPPRRQREWQVCS